MNNIINGVELILSVKGVEGLHSGESMLDFFKRAGVDKMANIISVKSPVDMSDELKKQLEDLGWTYHQGREAWEIRE